MAEIRQTASYEKLTEIAKTAIAQAIERHRKLGESIAVWKDGKVVVLTADQIPLLQNEDSHDQEKQDEYKS